MACCGFTSHRITHTHTAVRIIYIGPYSYSYKPACIPCITSHHTQAHCHRSQLTQHPAQADTAEPPPPPTPTPQSQQTQTHASTFGSMWPLSSTVLLCRKNHRSGVCDANERKQKLSSFLRRKIHRSDVCDANERKQKLSSFLRRKNPQVRCLGGQWTKADMDLEFPV